MRARRSGKRKKAQSVISSPGLVSQRLPVAVTFGHQPSHQRLAEQPFGHDSEPIPAHAGTRQIPDSCPPGLVTPEACPFGGACHTCPVQTKLTVDEPGDEYEQEADRLAEQVTAMPQPRLQRQEEEPEEEEEEEPVQTKRADGQAPCLDPSLEARICSLSGGQPLPRSERSFFEPRFGHDFGQVRVHTDARADRLSQAMNARAFTRGRDIAFGTGQYAPRTASGRRLLAHELTHVVQQMGHRQGSASSALQRYAKCESEEECPPREKGEVAKSETAEGFLKPDVRRLGDRELLIADFPVGSSTLRGSTTRELRWYLRGLRDPSIRIDVIGYTDCRGDWKINSRLRHSRARAVFNLLPRKLRKNAIWSMASLTDCVADNSTAERRARNRSVILKWSPPATPSPLPGEAPLTTVEGAEVRVEVKPLPSERLYGSLVPQGIWWFNGATPTFGSLYPTEAPVDTGLPPGDFHYQVTRGADKVGLLRGVTPVRELVGRDIPKPTVRSLGKSRRKGDVTVQVTHRPVGAKAASVYTAQLEVSAPHRVRYLGVDHGPSGPHGYLSLHYLQLLDNFARPIPYMDINEDFTKGTVARGVSAEWKTAIESRTKGSGWTLGSGVFTDKYEASVTGGPPPPTMKPTPVNPQPGRRGIFVGRFVHDWYAGTSVIGGGIHVSRHHGFFFADHGEYRKMKSPP